MPAQTGERVRIHYSMLLNKGRVSTGHFENWELPLGPWALENTDGIPSSRKSRKKVVKKNFDHPEVKVKGLDQVLITTKWCPEHSLCLPRITARLTPTAFCGEPSALGP